MVKNVSFVEDRHQRREEQKDGGGKTDPEASRLVVAAVAAGSPSGREVCSLRSQGEESQAPGARHGHADHVNK
jgi:hypothetical protein